MFTPNSRKRSHLFAMMDHEQCIFPPLCSPLYANCSPTRGVTPIGVRKIISNNVVTYLYPTTCFRTENCTPIHKRTYTSIHL